MLTPDALLPMGETQADSQKEQTAIVPEDEDAPTIDSLACVHLEARSFHISPCSFLLPTNSQPRDDDTDGTCGDDYAGSFDFYGSATDSIYQYRLENGRTYHAYSDGKYHLPNDAREQDRMDLVYHAINILFDGTLFFAPVTDPQRIVDMGTGTGIWALDVGDKYPEVQVIGVDLSPIQPNWTSPNVEFRIDDIDKPWVFSQPLDLIHSRVCSGIAIRSWPSYLAQAYQHLRPGGWVEAQEFNLKPLSDDNSFPPNSLVQEWHELYHAGLLLDGCNLRVSSQEMKRYMEEAGFVNVQIVETKMPMSPWSSNRKFRDAGQLAMESTLQDLSGMSLAIFTRLLDWEKERLEVFLAGVRQEWREEGIHGYWKFFAIFGQKPPEEPSISTTSSVPTSSPVPTQSPVPPTSFPAGPPIATQPPLAPGPMGAAT